MNDAPCRDCASREVGLSRGMREIQDVCRPAKASVGKPLYGLPRGDEQKTQSRALVEVSEKDAKRRLMDAVDGSGQANAA